MFGLFRQSFQQEFEALDPAPPRVSPRDERRAREQELREFEKQAAVAWREAVAIRKQVRAGTRRTARYLAAEEAFLARATALAELEAQDTRERVAAAERWPRPRP